jgi:hypothetical protein
MEPVNQPQQHIVGSAEPLNKEETRVRLQELEAWGVDLGLIRDSLQRTPIERVKRMLDLLAFANALHHAANS